MEKIIVEFQLKHAEDGFCLKCTYNALLNYSWTSSDGSKTTRILNVGISGIYIKLGD